MVSTLGESPRVSTIFPRISDFRIITFVLVILRPLEHLTEFENDRRRLVFALPFRSVRAITQSGAPSCEPNSPIEMTEEWMVVQF
jgi:hypothetical protein